MVIIKYIAQINASSKGLPRTLFLLIALLFGSILLVSCEEPEPTEELPSGVSGYVNGFAYVDLGLSVKWATCNVGAYAPDDYGNYYAWGETGFKTEYTSENSVTDGMILDSIEGNPTYDVATVRYGSPWRLPTRAEAEELIKNCDFKREDIHGIEGVRFTSRINGNSIYLPAAGLRVGTNLSGLGFGYYWTANSFGVEDVHHADAFVMNSVSAGTSQPVRRHIACSVRPVTE